MDTIAQAEPVSKAAIWSGRIISAIPVLMLFFSAGMKLSGSDQVIEGFAQFGYPRSLIRPLGIVELLCTIIYIVPRTSVLGAILLTGYLGGATATHVRLEDPAAIGAVLFGVMIWLGLYLRDRRIRALIPLRK